MKYSEFREYLKCNAIPIKEDEERLIVDSQFEVSKNEECSIWFLLGFVEFPHEFEMLKKVIELAETPLDERVSAIDDVKNPKHYKLEGLELEGKDIIKSVLGKDGYKNWCHGTALKYLFRAGKKEDELKDFKKAKEYISWIIKEMEE